MAKTIGQLEQLAKDHGYSITVKTDGGKWAVNLRNSSSGHSFTGKYDNYNSQSTDKASYGYALREAVRQMANFEHRDEKNWDPAELATIER